MANAIYPKYKEAVLGGGTNSALTSGTVKAALVDTGAYTYSAAHDMLDDLTGVVGTAVTLGSKTVTNGAFDSADPTWTSVSGNTVEAVVLYIDTGTPSTSRLVAYIDTGVTGLPITPDGGNIQATVHSSGWFTL